MGILGFLASIVVGIFAVAFILMLIGFVCGLAVKNIFGGK